VVLPMMCHDDEATAIERGIDGAHFFGYSLAHYYVFGEHEPGRTNIWEQFERDRADKGFAREIVTADQEPLGVKLLEEGMGSLRGGIGTPDQLTELCQRFQRAGVDQIVFAVQTGKTRHEHVCESLELFAEKVMPRFAQRADRVDAAKRDRLAPACKRAVSRREPPRPAPPGYVVQPGGEPTPAYEMRAARASAASNGGVSLAARVNKAAENAFAAFIRGRSDEQLDRLMGSGPGLRVAFGGMERAFVPENSGGFRGAIQWELEGSRGLRMWHVAIEDGRARARPGKAEDPKITMRMTVPMFARVLAREVDPAKAMLEGRLTVTGDFAIASLIGPMFGEDARW
jgi:hypothetical protein